MRAQPYTCLGSESLTQGAIPWGQYSKRRSGVLFFMFKGRKNTFRKVFYCLPTEAGDHRAAQHPILFLEGETIA